MKRRLKEVKVVIGANYGDEGKGLMTDYFTDRDKKCLVVCNNGGAQRGHTVKGGSLRHVFHHFGSGTLSGAETYFSRYFILNPLLFAEEYRQLRTYGLFPSDGRTPAGPAIYRHPDCLWSTPYDMMINQIVEEHRGSRRHGSCGVGIWETIVRSEKLHYPLDRFGNNPASLREYLGIIRDDYLPARLKELGIGRVPEKWKELIAREEMMDHFIEDILFLTKHTITAEDTLLFGYDRAIIENGQGLLLDRNITEDREHTTPSNTGLQNVAGMLNDLGIAFRNYAPSGSRNSQNEPDRSSQTEPGRNNHRYSAPIPVEVCYVTRTYLTRHGAGPFPGECDKGTINPLMIDETNMPNAFQGSLRYGIISPEALAERIAKDFRKYTGKCDGSGIFELSLAITHCNETSWLWNNRTPIRREHFQSLKMKRVYYSASENKEEIRAEEL